MNEQTKGSIKVLVDINHVKEALLREGFFDPTPLQVWKEGQIFGLVKIVSDLFEMHVRGYDDSTLESEIELSREYLEHPYDHKPYYGHLLTILRRYEVPYTLTRQLPSDPASMKVPKSRTPWKPIVIVAGIASLVGLFLWAVSHERKDEQE